MMSPHRVCRHQTRRGLRFHSPEEQGLRHLSKFPEERKVRHEDDVRSAMMWDQSSAAKRGDADYAVHHVVKPKLGCQLHKPLGGAVALQPEVVRILLGVLEASR